MSPHPWHIWPNQTVCPFYPAYPIGPDMFAMAENGTLFRDYYGRTICPKLPERIETLGSFVSNELAELGYIYPEETPMSVVYDLVDMAVVNLFPELAHNVRLTANSRYQRVLAVKVGMRAFKMIEAELD